MLATQVGMSEKVERASEGAGIKNGQNISQIITGKDTSMSYMNGLNFCYNRYLISTNGFFFTNSNVTSKSKLTGNLQKLS